MTPNKEQWAVKVRRGGGPSKLDLMLGLFDYRPDEEKSPEVIRSIRLKFEQGVAIGVGKAFVRELRMIVTTVTRMGGDSTAFGIIGYGVTSDGRLDSNLEVSCILSTKSRAGEATITLTSLD